MYYELLGGLVVASSVGVRDTHMATSICIYSAGRIILKPATSSFFAWGLSTGVRGGGRLLQMEHARPLLGIRPEGNVLPSTGAGCARCARRL